MNIRHAFVFALSFLLISAGSFTGSARADDTGMMDFLQGKIGGGGSSYKTKKSVSHSFKQRAGTIIIDTSSKTLHYIVDKKKAWRYSVAVGKQGFSWAGTNRISQKRVWPDWRPPASMRARLPHLPAFVKGGPGNPLGSHALYLGATLYRIHGTNEPWKIGQAVSSGCIRMTNSDVKHLYSLAKIGNKVIVRR